MTQINLGVSPGAAGVRDIIALRQQVLERSQLLKQLGETQAQGAPAAPGDQAGFADSLRQALDKVSETQNRANNLSEAYERGEVTDIAKVMMARQEAGLAFEATLQVRNRLLNAYQDIMRMGV
jgi:flagellar hook-basal body complex protein FliE